VKGAVSDLDDSMRRRAHVYRDEKLVKNASNAMHRQEEAKAVVLWLVVFMQNGIK